MGNDKIKQLNEICEICVYIQQCFRKEDLSIYAGYNYLTTKPSLGLSLLRFQNMNKMTINDLSQHRM